MNDASSPGGGRGGSGYGGALAWRGSGFALPSGAAALAVARPGAVPSPFPQLFPKNDDDSSRPTEPRGSYVDRVLDIVGEGHG